MEPISLTRQQLTTARWVADHSPDDAVTEVPVPLDDPQRAVVLLRFERSPIDNRWVLTTPVVVNDEKPD